MARTQGEKGNRVNLQDVDLHRISLLSTETFYRDFLQTVDSGLL